MSDQQYEWQCIGHNPTEWVLGINNEGQMTDIKARVLQLESGQWRWMLQSQGIGGTEASRGLAITEAERVLPLPCFLIRRAVH